MDGSARQPKEESPSQAGTLALIFCDALGGGSGRSLTFLQRLEVIRLDGELVLDGLQRGRHGCLGRASAK
jgi:hypothetical protein